MARRPRTPYNLAPSLEQPGDGTHLTAFRSEAMAFQLLNVLAASIDTVNILAEKVGGGRAALAPGQVAVSEAALGELYAKTEQLEVAERCIDDMETALKRASVMLGYDGRVDDDFLRMLKARPASTQNPEAYTLPNGEHTNVLTEAFAEWYHVGKEAQAAAEPKPEEA